tara:strand:- start:602 stop:889 length:288 start_codon:yes stop_codon:yes gene_type:complete
MKKNIFVLISLCFVMGCATQQFTTSGTSEVKRQDKFDHFFIGGIGQEAVVNAAEVCGGADNIAKIERSSTALNWLVNVLSFGIYTPEQSRVYCKR